MMDELVAVGDRVTPRDQDAAARLFDLLWGALADMLGTAAAATLLRRAIKQVASKTAWSDPVVVIRNGLDYECRLPEVWKQPGNGKAIGELDDRRHVAIEPRRILLVEDDDSVREALRRILRLDGHRIQVARDGPEGVELALATGPEVAFIDIGLPGIDGYEVGRRIRAGLGSRVLIVALTAHGLEEDRRRSTDAGFDAHLVKPVSYEDLTRVLGRQMPGRLSPD